MTSTWKYPFAALLLAVAALGGCAVVDDGPVSLEGGMAEQELLEAYADSVVASINASESFRSIMWGLIVHPDAGEWSTPRSLDPEKLDPETLAAYERQTGVFLK